MTVIRMKTADKRTNMYIGIYILANLLCFFQYKSMQAPSLLLTGLIVGIGFIIPYSELGIYLFACLPFFNMMNAQVGSTSMYYVLTGIAVLRYLLRGFNSNTPKKIVALCFLIALTCYNLTAVKEYVQWIIRVIPLVLFLREDIIQEHLADIIDKYTISMLFSSAWGWLMLQAGTSIYTRSYVYREGVVTIRFGGLVGDPVLYGIQLIFLISYIFILINKGTERQKLRIAAVALMCWFGTLTYSKTFFFCIVAEFLFFYIYWARHNKRSQRTLSRQIAAFIAATAALCLIAYFVLTSDTPWALNVRTRLLAADLATGRFTVWQFYADWCKNHWTSLFGGMGFSNYIVRRTFFSAATGSSYNIMFAHNLFIETAVSFGILETIALLAWLTIWAVNTYRSHRDYLYFLPLFMFLITGMITHGHFEYHFYLNVLLTLSVAESGITGVHHAPIRFSVPSAGEIRI